MRQAEQRDFDLADTIDPSTPGLDDPPDGPATTGNDGSLIGPRALMLAVLEDAIHCAGLLVHERRADSRRLRHRARAWMRSDDRDWLFSFESICEALSIDAHRLRRRVLNDQVPRPSGRRRRIHGLPRPPTRLKRRYG